MMVDIERLSRLCSSGRSQGEILAAMREQGCTITEAIKATMLLYGTDLSDAKAIVASDPVWMEAANASAPLHEELVRRFQEHTE